MSRLIRIATTLAVAGPLALLLLACGDDGTGASTPGSARDATAPAEEGSPATTSSGNRTPASGSAVRAELVQRIESQKGETFYIRYEFETEVEEDQARGALVIAQKPPKMYSEFSFEGKLAAEDIGGFFGFVVVSDGKNSYLCFKSDVEGQCLKGEGGTAEANMDSFFSPELIDEIVLQDEDADIRPASDRNVGGFDSKCWEVDSTQFDGLFCLSKEGSVLTFIEGEAEGARVTFVLKEFSKQVDDSLFKPPYPVMEFSWPGSPTPTNP